MQEKNRTKLLAGLLVGTLGFSVARPDKMITEPLNQADAAWVNAQAAYQLAEVEENDLHVAQAKLKKWAWQSLPPDPNTAMLKYRQWINDLAEECGLDQLEVEAGSKSRKSTRKSDVFWAVQVKVKGEATLAELSRFLYRFKRADLLQRVVNMSMESEDLEGDPYMAIDMVVEGICMQSAPTRLDLFNQSPLVAELDAEATRLAVSDTDGFPTSPGFQVKVGEEYMEVTDVAEDGTFTVKRGMDDSEPTEHTDKAKVLFMPVAQEMADTSFDQFEDFLANNPFVKPVIPRELDPRINPINDKKLIVGDDLSFKVTTADFDKEVGKPAFELADGHPEGMSIDKETGEVKWAPGDDVKVDEYSAEVLVTQANNDELGELKKQFKVNVVVENDEPRLTVPRRTITAWLGQPVTVDLKVEDETPADQLEFEIDGVDGAFIDSKTLAFNWRPAEGIDPGEYEVTIKVKDKGGKEAEATLRLMARDDAARYTKFTAAIGVGDEMEALFFDQINNKPMKLKVGSKLSVADISGDVKTIGDRTLVLTTEEGDMDVVLGRDLRTMQQEFAEELKQNAPAKEEEEATQEGEPEPGKEAAKEEAPAGADKEEAKK